MASQHIDLDAIGADGWADPDTVLAMVAELRAARDVVEAARGHQHYYGCALADALKRYDQHAPADADAAS